MSPNSNKYNIYLHLKTQTHELLVHNNLSGYSSLETPDSIKQTINAL